jgi:hypothetical protein
MNEEIKARLPFGPDDPWYEFVEVYSGLPLKKTPHGGFKEVTARSNLIPAGLRISSTITDTQEVGRISFPLADSDSVGKELLTAFVGWGWELLTQGNDRLVLRKSLPLHGGATTMPMAFLNVLPKLGVSPKQDWSI